MAPKKDSERFEIAELKQKRIITNILRIKKSIQDKTISSNQMELECRLEILTSYIEQAMDLQNELETIDVSINTRAELEDICVSTKALLKTPLAKFNRNSKHDLSNVGSHSHSSKLPQMRLPKFNGKYSEFKNFFCLFENLVHNDPSLSQIEKFNHLISCLSGDALGTIKAFQVTEQNYQKALDSLSKVYDNKCLIFFDTISQLFDLPVMGKPTASGLRTTIDTVSAVYDSLLSVGDDRSITNAILIHLVLSKIDSESRSKFEEQLDFNTLPMWSDCEKVLNKRFQQISAEESAKGRNVVSKGNKPDKTKCAHTVAKQESSSFACCYCKNNNHILPACTLLFHIVISYC